MKLKGKKIAVFVAPLFEDLEFWYPYYRLQEEGAEVSAIGPEKKQYTGKNGLSAVPELAINETRAIDFDALVIPGGYSPDHMRRSPEMVEFVREMNKQRKVVGAICHGPWMMASADIVKGKKVTGFQSIRGDLENAGAEWADIKAVKDGNLVTSRRPDDLPAFCTAIIEAISNA